MVPVTFFYKNVVFQATYAMYYGQLLKKIIWLLHLIVDKAPHAVRDGSEVARS